MGINTNNEGNVSQNQVMEAIQRQLDKNGTVSHQFNMALYTEVKGEMLNNSERIEGAQEYGNGRTR